MGIKIRATPNKRKPHCMGEQQRHHDKTKYSMYIHPGPCKAVFHILRTLRCVETREPTCEIGKPKIQSKSLNPYQTTTHKTTKTTTESNKKTMLSPPFIHYSKGPKQPWPWIIPCSCLVQIGPSVQPQLRSAVSLTPLLNHCESQSWKD